MSGVSGNFSTQMAVIKFVKADYNLESIRFFFVLKLMVHKKYSKLGSVLIFKESITRYLHLNTPKLLELV